MPEKLNLDSVRECGNFNFNLLIYYFHFHVQLPNAETAMIIFSNTNEINDGS